MTTRRSDFINRIGEERITRFGSKMRVIDHLEGKKILIEFENGFRTTSKFEHFNKGRVHTPYDKSVYGVGYMGEGPYNFQRNYKHTEEYRRWHGIFQRCYSEKVRKKFPTYKNCTVCEEWINFQNFGEWYTENKYYVEGEVMEIDKDILIKGNKHYSPGTVLVVPSYINALFTKNDKCRGDLPIGVHKKSDCDRYGASCSGSNNKRLYLGIYPTPEEAFLAYKKYKEKTIAEVAELYKRKIPQKVYQALLNYRVEIGD